MFGNSDPEIERQKLEIAVLKDRLAVAKNEAAATIVADQRLKKVSPDIEELQRQYEHAEQDAAKWALCIRDPDAEPRSVIKGESTQDRDSRLRGGLKESVTKAYNFRMVESTRT